MKRSIMRTLAGALATTASLILATSAVAQLRPGAGQQPPAGGTGGQARPGSGQLPPTGGGQQPPAGGQVRPGADRPMTPAPGAAGRPTAPDDRRGAEPARPFPGQGRPAEPAEPRNPRARENVQDTPSRTGETPSRSRDRGDDRAATQTRLPEGVTSESMVSGLTKVDIDTLNITNIQNNIINVSGAMPGTQVQATINAVQNNPTAANIAQQLTSKLIDQGVLKQGQQVVGFQDGKLFVTGGTSAGTNTGGTTPMPGTSGSGNTTTRPGGTTSNTNTGAGSPGTTNNVTQANITGDTLLRGLVNLNVQNLNVQASDLVNLNDVLNNSQVQAVLQALNLNPKASAAAEQLTSQLQDKGILKEGQRVVGARDGKIYVTSATTAGSGTNTQSGSGNTTTRPMTGGTSGNTTSNTNTGAGSPGTTNTVTQLNATGRTFLQGLINANVQNLNVQASNLINANEILNDVQLQALVQALNINPDAKATANKLTTLLQDKGLLQEGQRVIGMADGKVYVTGAAK